VLVARSRHPLAQRRELTRADLVTQRWVIGDQPHSQDALEKYFAIEGLPAPLDVLRTNSLPLMVSLVRSGQFLSTLAEHLIGDALRSGDIRRLPLADAVIERQAGLIYRRDASARPATGYVIDAFRRSCAALGGPAGEGGAPR